MSKNILLVERIFHRRRTLFKKLAIVFIGALIVLNTTAITGVLADDKKPEAEKAKPADQKEEVLSPEELKAFEDKCSLTDPVDLVGNPHKYMDKYILLNGTFDKFTTLGLDYKPAFKDSKDYISFLIQRPDKKTKKYTVPLSELKLIVARKTAEKYPNLETGDNLKIYGKVFSTALNDPWVEVDHITSSEKDLTATPKPLE